MQLSLKLSLLLLALLYTTTRAQESNAGWDGSQFKCLMADGSIDCIISYLIVCIARSTIEDVYACNKIANVSYDIGKNSKPSVRNGPCQCWRPQGCSNPHYNRETAVTREFAPRSLRTQACKLQCSAGRITRPSCATVRDYSVPIL